MKLAISGVKVGERGYLWRMAPSKVDATITVGKKPEVEVEQQELKSLPGAMTVPPFSVNIYSFPVQ